MTWAADTVSALDHAGVDFVAYLPDSAVAPLVDELAAADGFETVLVSREEAAVGVLAGAWLAGRRGALVCQSSGLANALNAVASLSLPARIPFVGLVGRRGALGEFNLAQVPGGYAMPAVLDAMGVRNASLSRPEDVADRVEMAAYSAFSTETPYVVWLETTLTGHKDEVTEGER